MIQRIDNFVESNINPITNIPYDDTWVVYCLTKSTDYKTKVGSSTGAVYIVKASKSHPNWKMSVCDFIEFQKSKGKNIILAISEDDLEEAQNYYKGHNYNAPFLRDNEPDILIHSTTFDNWLSIKEDKCLKSWNALKKEKVIWEDNQ